MLCAIALVSMWSEGLSDTSSSSISVKDGNANFIVYLQNADNCSVVVVNNNITIMNQTVATPGSYLNITFPVNETINNVEITGIYSNGSEILTFSTSYCIVMNENTNSNENNNSNENVNIVEIQNGTLYPIDWNIILWITIGSTILVLVVLIFTQTKDYILFVRPERMNQYLGRL